MSLADEVNSATPAAAPVLRVGVVQATPAPTAEKVSVLIFEDTDPVRLKYQAGYVPVAGDVVSVLLVGGSTTAGIVLGGRAGQAGNLVANSAFQRHPQPQVSVSKPPYMWAQYVASGQAVIVAGSWSSLLQRHVMLMATTSGVTGVNYAYSAAIPVTAGETLYGDLVYDALCFAGTPTTLTVDLRLGWFASETDIYPNYLSESTLASQVTNTAGGDPWAISGSAVAPSAATHARVGIRTSQTGGNLQFTLRVTAAELTRSTS